MRAKSDSCKPGSPGLSPTGLFIRRLKALYQIRLSSIGMSLALIPAIVCFASAVNDPTWDMIFNDQVESLSTNLPDMILICIYLDPQKIVWVNKL